MRIALAVVVLCIAGRLFAGAPPAPREGGRRPSPAQIFKWLDKDRDGVLTEEEYVKHSRFADKDKARAIFRAADTDGDGRITEKRYVEHRRITDKAKDIFTKLDADGDGRMTEREFLAGARAIFQALDRDGDGGVTIPEYLSTRAEWSDMRGPSVDDLLRLLGATAEPKTGK